MKKAKPRDVACVPRLAGLTRIYKPAPERAIDKLFGRYPLLSVTEKGFLAFEGDEADAWLEYIKLVDRDREAN